MTRSSPGGLGNVSVNCANRYMAARGLSTTQGSAQEDKGKDSGEGEEKKKGFEVPWGLLITLTLVGSIIGYFYRGNKNTKIMKKLQNQMEQDAALSPEEVEEIRETNKLNPVVFNLLATRIKQRFPQGEAKPSEFFDFVGTQVGGEQGTLKSQHLFERLALVLEAGVPNQMVSTEVLMTAITMTLDSDIEERVRTLFKVFTGSKADGTKMNNDQLQRVIDSLMLTNQLPIRCMTREINHYPYKIFEQSTSLFLAQRAVEQEVKRRKKAKTLGEHEEESLAGLTSELKRADQLRDPESNKSNEDFVKIDMQKPEWTIEDFNDLLHTRAICAWGECQPTL